MLCTRKTSKSHLLKLLGQINFMAYSSCWQNSIPSNHRTKMAVSQGPVLETSNQVALILWPPPFLNQEYHLTGASPFRLLAFNPSSFLITRDKSVSSWCDYTGSTLIIQDHLPRSIALFRSAKSHFLCQITHRMFRGLGYEQLRGVLSLFMKSLHVLFMTS